MKRKNENRPADSNDRKPLADVRLDAELMNQLSASEGKDDRPLAELMARHERLVFNELRCRNIRLCDADEVAARVWVKVWEIGRDAKWDSGRARHSQDSFVPLLKRVANSQAMDFHKRAAVQRRRVSRIVEAFETWGEDWNEHLARPSVRAVKSTRPAAAGMPDRLKPFVEVLPERLKAAYELHAKGLTNRKIAEQVGCSWGEVSKRLKAARAAIAAYDAGTGTACTTSQELLVAQVS